ncbi:hypothetical protein [Haladaptatus caseinilyticus]|uniref:hypothetical protein n=1 Tax=Haladaptatus caseinilyticus TaxID=2993314 RepID=UPI00224A8614|nr:hypothetical protein [Haladaptatus caseinilyticus]
MTMYGMPTTMFLVFVATILAGSLGAIHYTVVHVLLGKPVNENVRKTTTEPRATDGGHNDG